MKGIDNACQCIVHPSMAKNHAKDSDKLGQIYISYSPFIHSFIPCNKHIPLIPPIYLTGETTAIVKNRFHLPLQSC